MAVLASSGKLTYLRVNDVGTGWGAPPDALDVEVIAKLNGPGDADKAFGFQLRNDENRVARQGMLDLLRDAFRNNWTVTLDYYLDPGKHNGRIFRVVVTR